ncbi:DEAD/DEAH box helicase [Kocuria marina]|uniref:DEAD/DEAH box helicase n=1 Tax=Kocuria marina TaxID=223184 RepID=UPI0019D23B9C|nr:MULTISPECIES: DEAD/DEAH box helicase [Kocuria]MBN6812914.1 AAA family ATPase [Kocuria indica]MBN6844639.1 AAA family ATPase [Kocuria indica]MCT1723231.1 AAA domain-containing protein [Kocuria marina]MCT1734969.1 AAA domain-containing protein [Kocuria marina]
MAMSQMSPAQQRILDYWWMLELFSPQPIPKVTPRSTRPEDRQVITWAPGEPLPWNALPAPRPVGTSPREWRHTVYLGVYRVEDTYEIMHRVFADDPAAYDERPGGTSACAGVLVDHSGKLIGDTATLSSCLWAVSRIIHPGPQDTSWATGFDRAQNSFLDALDALGGRRREQKGSPEAPLLDHEHVEEILHTAHDTAGIRDHPDLATSQIIIESRAVAARPNDNVSDIDFLNSFYLQDLDTVRQAAAAGRSGTALLEYLTEDGKETSAGRVDVIQYPEAVDARTRVDQLPLGRWPSNPEHPLALSQQFAVNRALNDLRQNLGVMGVNGPPGTGKTTMLRDVLAGNVVERARRLAALDDPSRAFTGSMHRWTSTSGYSRSVPQLIPELTGFEMVVASANNAAVENVAVEIPSADAISSPWEKSADYFKDIATATLRAAAGKSAADEADTPGWGLVAARLGKKSNRMAFQSALWFDEKASRDRSTGSDGAPSHSGGRTSPRVKREGLDTILKHWAEGTRPKRTWGEAQAVFQRALERVENLMGQRQAAEGRREEVQLLVRKIARREEHLRTLRAEEGRAREIHRAQVLRAGDLQNELDTAAAAYQQHMGEKPGILETIFTLGAAPREWRTHLSPLSTALETARQRSASHAAEIDRVQRHLASVRQEAETAERDLAMKTSRRRSLEAQCAQDRTRYGKHHPDAHASVEDRELHAPWLDYDLSKARSDLFLAALELHQDFMAATATAMRQGLRAACEVVAGDHPRKLEREKLRAAWQLFFLVVPLVSSTFASLGRMFGDVGPEAFGWLLIDEAGQACPQFAVGAIWRAQRVLAVGDPLQLQPVVTIPPKSRRDIAAAYGVSATWIPPRASVQTLADRISPYGTVLPQGEQDVWVSAPLKVHRRCEDPMFSLCNRIAYNGIMVNGVPKPRAKDAAVDPFEDTGTGPAVAWSYWADEPATTPGTHLQMGQVKRLEKALEYLDEKGVDPSRVIAISPFRDVSNHLRQLVDRKKYPGLQAGTIHTAQGREADVVILVLGGDPASPGAKAWAASTVNLVNVAASRARRRLYVIGDRSEWSGHRYFSDLSDALK